MPFRHKNNNVFLSLNHLSRSNASIPNHLSPLEYHRKFTMSTLIDSCPIHNITPYLLPLHIIKHCVSQSKLISLKNLTLDTSNIPYPYPLAVHEYNGCGNLLNPPYPTDLDRISTALFIFSEIGYFYFRINTYLFLQYLHFSV